MNKHYGKLINRIIREKGHSFQSIAKHLNIDKKVVLSWLNEPIPSVESINQIGDVIIHSFATDFPELFDGKTIRPEKQPSEVVSEETKKAFFRDKYISLLEKYNSHLLKIIKNCREEHGEACCRT